MHKSHSFGSLVLTYFFLLIIGFPVYSHAQTATLIKGNAKTYAGDRLSVYSHSDYITNQRQHIASCTVDSAGDFTMAFDTEDYRKYIMPLGVFEGEFFAAPGDTIILALPERIEMSKADSLNPYFTPQKHFLRNLQEKENDLTGSIREFEQAYFRESEQLFENFKGRIHPQRVDSAVERLQAEFPNDEWPFFKAYKTYKFLSLRHTAYKRTTDAVIEKYFSGKPVLYHNPAYNEALWMVAGYDLKPADLNDTDKTRQKLSLWEALNNVWRKKPEYSDDRLREYVLLSNLHRLAAKNREKSDVFIALFKDAQSLSRFPEHKKIAQRIIESLSGLMNGRPAPAFVLKDAQGNEKSLSDYSQQFLYLNFFSTDSYVGQKELDLLEVLNKEELPALQIVTIYKGDDYDKFKEFVNQREYSFDLLFAQVDHPVFESYRLVSFPEYYLISPSGKIVMISAPGPARDFRSTYGPFFIEWNREQVRRKSQGNNNSLINE